MTAPLVTVTEGKVQGKLSQDYLGQPFYSFLGIPYAESPVGELRFKAPVPVKRWEGIRDATKEGPESPSLHMFFAYHVGSETDCLNLNVYTKKLPKSDGDTTNLKPVMVWIHGGAFVYGSNKSEYFGPEYLMTEDIVLVSINYRLGVLGFLSLEDPSLGVPGNAGMKDMVLALKWIQKNISKFNGDPKNVTIFGESAGSAAVHYLYLSPLSKGLFHKAIAQSGCALNCWARGEPNAKIIANGLGYKETDEKKILDYLKQTPVNKLVKAQLKTTDSFTSDTLRPFGPVIEKPSNEPAFLLEDPVDILKNGTFNHVPIIMGYTSREGMFFEAVRKIRPSVVITSDFETEIHFELKLKKGSDKSKEVAKKIERFYFGTDKPTHANLDKLYLLKTDTQFVHGIHRSISLQTQNSKCPVYAYRISLDTSINFYKKICCAKSIHGLFFVLYIAYKSGDGRAKNWFLNLSNMIPSNTLDGVCHADDLGYLFRSFYSPKIKEGTIEDTSIKRFVKLWTNFARTGNPTPDPESEMINVEWKPVTKDEHLCLDIGKDLKAGSNPDLDRMQFWDSIYNT